MMAGVLADLRSRASHADLVRARDETITVVLSANREATVSIDQSDTVQIRALANGRLGWAGGDTATVGAVVESALRSAAAGDTAEMFFPAPAPIPSVITRSPAAAALTVPDLLDLAGSVADRLRQLNRRVETWAERSVGTVDVGSSRGVLASYDVTVVGLGVSVAGGPGPCQVHVASVPPPDDPDLESLVAEVEARFAPQPLDLDGLPATARVWFKPRAVRALLAPLLVRHSSEWNTNDRGRPMVIDGRLSLVDDPLIDGRPGSRPVCDDGIPTQRRTLIRGGQPVAGLLDLRTASRLRLPATGHGIRRGFRPPVARYSNLVLEVSEPGVSDLARAVGDGLLVSELEVGPAPNPAPGVFRVAVPWCYRIVGGRIVGRVERAVLAGDVGRLFQQVAAIGADAQWHGAVRVPSLVLDGVGVTLR